MRSTKANTIDWFSVRQITTPIGIQISREGPPVRTPSAGRGASSPISGNPTSDTSAATPMATAKTRNNTDAPYCATRPGTAANTAMPSTATARLTMPKSR
jgi:hypothetical protein